MNLTGTPNNIIINNILSGYYSENVIVGIKPHLFDFSSPTYLINNFQAPYDAKLNIFTGNQNSLQAVGRKIPNPTTPSFDSNRSGVLYYSDNATIYGVCHGFSGDSLTYYQGYNFYNAHYAPGYFSPPFGENISILKYDTNDDESVLGEGVCSDLNITEYNEIYGINSFVSSEANITSNDLQAGNSMLLSTPKAACPEDAVSDFFDEWALYPIQGTVTELGANNLFNGNPIPTSLDNYEIRLLSRYSTFVSGGGSTGITYLNYNSSGQPIASYFPSSQQNKLNNTLCEAQIIETSTDFGIGTNGLQLLLVPDAGNSAVGSQASFIGVADPWNMWQFNFEENSDSFPFSDGFSVEGGGVHQLLASEGTALFNSTLAVEDNYWQNRQCPSTVDYLPWTFGASIYACPSYHFDIPYYAAINKFGFYGMRFMNNCAGLSLTYPYSGVPNAMEVQQSFTPQPIGVGKNEPEGIDAFGSQGNFTQYDNLLSIAKAESSYSNMYALNKGFFIWSNNQYINTTSQFNQLNQKYPGFIYLYSGLISPFQNIFSGGITGYSKFEPDFINNNAGNIISSSWIADTLLTNNVYNTFIQNLPNILSGQDYNLWNEIENAYAYYVTNGQGSVNESFYENLITGRDARLLTRYFNNLVTANPIDLFPLNQVIFSYDKAQDYLESTGWNRLTTSFGLNSPIPQINRRYFVGAYGNGGDISGVIQAMNQLSLVNGSYFYPGFFNDVNINKDMPALKYESVNSGIILDEKLRSFSPSGWLALGYGGIGQLDKNFSCFTPIFIQQPLQQVYCKIGQAPTLRSLAVDYHTIPEDKISYRYTELVYWLQKLKIVDNSFNNLYPLQYKWYRVPKGNYSTMVQQGNFALATPSSSTGNWACLEGDGPDCTVINPLLSLPTGTLGSTDNYTFVKGITYGTDDSYFYFCMVSGRFGIRMSEASSLVVENWARFDVSFKNAINANASLSISFMINDGLGNNQQINFPTSSSYPPYNGYQRDEYAVVENQASQKIPPPNAGYGDVSALAPVGPIKYIGALRSYTPSTVRDTRGLREDWGRFIDYGTLVPFYKILSQNEGDWLYGYSHLPICNNYQMNNGQAGIQISPTLNGNKILHWSLSQRAVASYQQTWVGVPWEQLNTFGALYPPITPSDYEAGQDYESLGIGQWQWYNNFGAIKRFGHNSTYQTNDIVLVGNGSPSSNDQAGYNTQIALIKQKWIKSTDLAGYNCGYTPFGLGRNMIFYIEAFDRFYIYCDPLKKKNVQDLNYMNPGIRLGNSSIQYFWLGKPNNTYVERRAMYGPYAYQWRVRKHNRDRNGNGISQGFYSMGWEAPYSEMYDAPAIYGLYSKVMDSPQSMANINNITQLRNTAGYLTEIGLRGNWFGTTNDEGTSNTYGSTWLGDCSNGGAACNYYSAFSELAGQPDFENYACTPLMIQNKQCFDPCLSIRYAQGFFPGGKSQNMFNLYGSNKNIRLVPTANNAGNSPILYDEQSQIDKSTFFRSPVNTPHAQLMRILGNTIVGISPCKDGGSDHCNYITPTVHLGTSSFLQGQTTSFLALVNLMESIVGNYSG